MGRSLRLLLVEDHVDSAELLAELLQNAGHTVCVATTVSDAIAFANEQSFDVVVSDVGLPDASGYELMEQLRARSSIKGIAMTGSGRESDIARGREAGFAMHLTKPVSLRRLEQALQELTA
jgi:two-component system, chemotaxis family, CheB/CheR fusion protein